MWPGINNQANYTEAMLMGYRCYDSAGLRPAYPFGHGLTYTTWSVTDLQVQGRTVSCVLANTGGSTAAQVVQLYVGLPASTGSPVKQLKGFTKATLQAGAQQTVSFQVSDRDVSVWSVEAHAWELVSGEVSVMVGTSSRDEAMLQAKMAV
eukprot:TRINITY_DN10524_c0_g3_i2.p2 TRINITY_DN10524_c0_g3~~TRINITY_DN10524_c0_g3_i2.p2  ORF type:complete len:150 (-),score=39.61 TRINITY_DN10524_c0_g3_i2:228-677(-)